MARMFEHEAEGVFDGFVRDRDRAHAHAVRVPHNAGRDFDDLDFERGERGAAFVRDALRAFARPQRHRARNEGACAFRAEHTLRPRAPLVPACHDKLIEIDQMVAVQMRQEQRVDIGPARTRFDQTLGNARAAIDQKLLAARAHKIGRPAPQRIALRTARSQQHQLHRGSSSTEYAARIEQFRRAWNRAR